MKSKEVLEDEPFLALTPNVARAIQPLLKLCSWAYTLSFSGD
jgi:hypothetical protein